MSILCRLFDALEKGFEFVSVLGWLIAFDSHQFSGVAFAVAAFDVQEQLDGVDDVGADGGVGEFYASLENAAREPSYGLLGGVRVNSR
jgi:hypothetical protein